MCGFTDETTQSTEQGTSTPVPERVTIEVNLSEFLQIEAAVSGLVGRGNLYVAPLLERITEQGNQLQQEFGIEALEAVTIPQAEADFAAGEARYAERAVAAAGI